ncbi:MAG TPA: PTS system mannose/fructose/sorbose family transporter subunit IID [Sedimentibacter sp.]|nr:PTS system mannose/fructose/sorbose family transporter subunit IID [Sedimentibacter sp.]
MAFSDYVLFSVFYFWASSTALSIGIGYYTIYRPILAGLAAGLILNDVQTGMMAGAVVNIIYIDFVSTGGSFKGDQCLTALMAAVASIAFGIHPLEAAALAFPFGFLGILIWKYRLRINNTFVHMYEKKYKENKAPDISLYDGLFPQLLLLFMSSAVITAGLLLMFSFNRLINFKNISALYYIGLILVIFSSFNILYKIKNKYNFIIFAVVFLAAAITEIRAYIMLILIALILLFTSNKKINIVRNKLKGSIKKGDLVYSWFIWMNYSHSCYSYERLMGLAFAHSMKNIIKKLYKDKHEIAEAVHNHTEFFNTEPNMGTPILGYIISLEEERKISRESFENISYIKKGMMGISAGLGDSFTQVVLTPLFVSMAVMLCLDKSYNLAFIPVIYLAAYILFISYNGFMNGYFQGKDSMLKRVRNVKESRLKKYFPCMFSGILGLSMSSLLFNNIRPLENLFTLVIILLAAGLTFLRRRREQ